MKPLGIGMPLCAAIALAVVPATGCQHDSVAPPKSGLVLKIEMTEGGIRPAGSIDLPSLALYADGTMIVPSDIRGAVPAALRYQLPRDAVDLLFDRAWSAGFGESTEYGGNVPDAPIWTVTIRSRSGRARTRIVGPDLRSSLPSGAAARAVRSLLAESIDKEAGNPNVFSPDRLAVVSSALDLSRQPQVATWPLPPLGVGPTVNAGHCMSYSGLDLPAASKAGQLATPGSLWLSNGKTYRLYFRPLLPDELGCADLNAE